MRIHASYFLDGFGSYWFTITTERQMHFSPTLANYAIWCQACLYWAIVWLYVSWFIGVIDGFGNLQECIKYQDIGKL